MESCLSWAEHMPKALLCSRSAHQRSIEEADSHGGQSWWEAGTHRLYSFQATPQGADLLVQLSHAVGESDILAVSKQLTGVSKRHTGSSQYVLGGRHMLSL